MIFGNCEFLLRNVRYFLKFNLILLFTSMSDNLGHCIIIKHVENFVWGIGSNIIGKPF